jgi:hypothetical protein
MCMFVLTPCRLIKYFFAGGKVSGISSTIKYVYCYRGGLRIMIYINCHQVSPPPTQLGQHRWGNRARRRHDVSRPLPRIIMHAIRDTELKILPYRKIIFLISAKGFNRYIYHTQYIYTKNLNQPPHYHQSKCKWTSRKLFSGFNRFLARIHF